MAVRREEAGENSLLYTEGFIMHAQMILAMLLNKARKHCKATFITITNFYCLLYINRTNGREMCCSYNDRYILDASSQRKLGVHL